MIKLIHGDCLEMMKSIPSGSVDMVLTDPPYGLDYQSQWKKEKSKWMPKIKNDKVPFIAFIAEAERCLTDGGCAVIFCRYDSWISFSNELERVGLRVKSQIVWDKVIHGMGDLRGATALQHELAIFATKGRFKFWAKRQKSIVRHVRVNAKDMQHPNEKPVSLMEDIVAGYCPPGGVVLDCFTGVSPVGVACVNTGRKFVGIELDDRYFDIAQTRIDEAVKTAAA
jgi:site-specific DNA-methyltransferase (adenine-specific)